MANERSILMDGQTRASLLDKEMMEQDRTFGSSKGLQVGEYKYRSRRCLRTSTGMNRDDRASGRDDITPILGSDNKYWGYDHEQ